MAVISLFLASFAGNVHVRHSRVHSGKFLVKMSDRLKAKKSRQITATFIV